MATLLRDAGIENALIHGGTSSAYGIGGPFRIRIAGAPDETATIELMDSALAVSAPHGKSFRKDGRQFGHVIDPRTGHPAQSADGCAVLHSSATDADALSTAWLIDPTAKIDDPGVRFQTCWGVSKDG
jgi:thiamine biosynthesis lipoprotein